ncbi:MAG: EF-P lysine aminoacylase EpmA [Endozoicomonadaceae bacterium]|nr:EF-P lysine aminoacylase EpmA [Endozoicomonadaceae bacterium]
MSAHHTHWQPSASVQQLQRRALLLRNIREYFFTQQVMETEVPILSSAATVDLHIESFCTEFTSGGTSAKKMYLHTSPEFAMKRLLAAGSGDIYYLGPVFRNGEYGRYHNPEFTMLEWYRCNLDDQQLMDDISRLLTMVCDNYKELQRVSYQTLFQQHFGINPHTVTTDVLTELVKTFVDENLKDLADNDLLDLLFTHKIEPALHAKGENDTLSGVFVYDYPAGMAALARLKTDDQGQQVAARFELFVNGIELVNGYHELTTASEQQQRFLQDQQQRKAMHLPVYPYDKKLVAALHHGLPDCAGVALGIDRLHMLLTGETSIKDIMAFDFTRV